MQILVVGMNHTTAPVELRERVTVQGDELRRVLEQLRDTHTVLESVVVSTCNRTEFYVVVSSLKAGKDYLKTWFANQASIDKASIGDSLYQYDGEYAVRHLLKVVAGLDSMVLGETQILGQVRDAFMTASSDGNTGSLFNQLFRTAIQLGRRAQTETEIGQHPVSVSYAAVQLAKKVLGNLDSRSALVIGAGKMSQLSLQHLRAAGVEHLYVANRTYARAEEVAKESMAVAVPWERVHDMIGQVDLVVSSTSATEYVVTKADLMNPATRHNGPTVMIDIAMPRDLDPAIADVPTAFLFDLDDLEGVVEANMEVRRRQAETVEVMIDEAILSFSDWLSEQEVVPLISAIRAKATAVQLSVMESLDRKMPGLSERDRKLLQKHTMSIVNQILRDPIQNMKEMAITSSGGAELDVLAKLFGVTEADLEGTPSLLNIRSTEQVATGRQAQRVRTSVEDLTEASRAVSGVRRLHAVLR